MITIYVPNQTFFSNEEYHNLISGIELTSLICTCGQQGRFIIHGYYQRCIRFFEEKITIKICRIRCHCCKKTHALIPSSIVPYSQIPLSSHVEIISAFRKKERPQHTYQNNPGISEYDRRTIIKSFLRKWIFIIKKYQISLKPISTLISECFKQVHMQFMQPRNIPNILYEKTTQDY